MGIGRPVVLVGHSVGSLIIRMFAAAHPEQVAGTVHVDGSLPRLILWPGGGGHVDGEGPDATEIDLASEQGRDLAARAGVAFAPGVLVDGRLFGYGRLSERRLRRALGRLAPEPH